MELKEQDAEHSKKNGQIDRRNFLKLAGIVAGTLVLGDLSGCGESTNTETNNQAISEQSTNNSDTPNSGNGDTMSQAEIEQQEEAEAEEAKKVIEAIDGSKQMSTSDIENVNSALHGMSKEDQIQTMKIPANLGTEQLANLFVRARLTEWLNYGSGPELRDDGRAANKSWKDYTAIVAENGRDIFTQAMFMPGWEQDQSLVNIVDKYEGYNSSSTYDYGITKFNTQEKCEEGFVSINDVYSVIENLPKNEKGERNLSIWVTSSNNSQLGTNKNFISNQKSGIHSEIFLSVVEPGDGYCYITKFTQA